MPKTSRATVHPPVHAPVRSRRYIKVYITTDLSEALTDTAETWGCSVSDVVRRVLRGALLQRIERQ